MSFVWCVWCFSVILQTLHSYYGIPMLRGKHPSLSVVFNPIWPSFSFYVQGHVWGNTLEGGPIVVPGWVNVWTLHGVKLGGALLEISLEIISKFISKWHFGRVSQDRCILGHPTLRRWILRSLYWSPKLDYQASIQSCQRTLVSKSEITFAPQDANDLYSTGYEVAVDLWSNTIAME